MATTPRPLITPILIAINVAVFVVMLASGFSFTKPKAESFLRWGADFGPLTTHGQWWRLVTAALRPWQLIHLLMNMLILLSIGLFTDGSSAASGFIVLYFFAGIGGNLAGLALHPFTVSMGASGAISVSTADFLAVLLLHRHTGAAASRCRDRQERGDLHRGEPGLRPQSVQRGYGSSYRGISVGLSATGADSSARLCRPIRIGGS